MEKFTDNLSGIIGDKSGDVLKYTKNNSFKFMKQFPIIFKSLVINTQSILLSIVIITILCGVIYLLYFLYSKHPRSFGVSNFLPISGTKDNKPKSLDLLYYESLSKSLAYFVYNNELPLFANVFKSDISASNKQKYLDYINSQIFFHKNFETQKNQFYKNETQSNEAYKKFSNFEITYNKQYYNKKWGLKSIEGLKQFFMDILTKNFNIPKTTIDAEKKKNKDVTTLLINARTDLIGYLKTFKTTFEVNLQKVINDNIYSFISAFNYINNTPQNDYILNTYGKFIKVKIDNGNTYKYLKELLNINTGELSDILQYDKLSNENKIIKDKLSALNIEYNDISSGELLDTYIFRTINGTPDSSDFDTYMKFVKDFGTTGNTFVNSILQISDPPNINNSISLTRQQQYNIDLVTPNQKLKLLIYQDIIIYRKFKVILNNYDSIIQNPNLVKILLKDYNWHLERLTYSKYFNGENIIRVFNESQIVRFNKITSNIFDLINYPVYKSEMSYGLFAVLYIFLSNDSINERLKQLSEYYMSFSELYLAAESLEDFEALKNKRDNINLFKEFLKPAIKYFAIDIIYKKLIAGIIWEDQYRSVAPLWNSIRNKLVSGSTYFDCEDKKFAKLSFCKIETFINDADIIEEFKLGNIFAPILDPIKAIVEFVKNVGKIIAILISAITDPLKFIRILLGLLLWFMVNIHFIILDLGIKKFSDKEIKYYVHYQNGKEFGQKKLTIGRIICSFFYRTLWLLPIGVFNASIYLILLLTRIVLILVVVVLDFITKKRASGVFYSLFIACENSPFAWYENSFFQKGNIVERDLVCKKKCPDGFKVANNGNTCEKIPNYVPNYCPQAQLMRVYKGLKISGPLNLKEYSLPRGLNDAQKEQYIVDFKKNKKDFHDSCQNLSMVKYDNVAKSICSNMEFTKNSNISQKDIKDICYNKFCKNGNHESFCTKLNEFEYNTGVDNIKGDLIRTITTYCLVISLLTLGIYIIDQKIDLLNKANLAFQNIKTNISKNIPKIAPIS